MRLEGHSPIWIVSHPISPRAQVRDICTQTTMLGLPPHLAVLMADPSLLFFTTSAEAHEEAHRRLADFLVVQRVRAEQEIPAGEPLRVRVSAPDGRVLFDGDLP